MPQNTTPFKYQIIRLDYNEIRIKFLTRFNLNKEIVRDLFDKLEKLAQK